MALEKAIEALLFETGEEISIKTLVGIFACEEEEVQDALEKLEKNLEGRGIVLVRNDTSAMLAAAKEITPIIKAMRKKELTAPLSDAALDTLSIVLYAGPVLKRDIDTLRGVNSQTILRTLRARDLVRREESGKEGAKERTYSPSLQLMRHLGVQSAKDLPDYEPRRKKLTGYLSEA